MPRSVRCCRSVTSLTLLRQTVHGKNTLVVKGLPAWELEYLALSYFGKLNAAKTTLIVVVADKTKKQAAASLIDDIVVIARLWSLVVRFLRSDHSWKSAPGGAIVELTERTALATTDITSVSDALSVVLFLTRLYVKRDWPVYVYHHMLAHLPVAVANDVPLHKVSTTPLERRHRDHNAIPTNHINAAQQMLSWESRLQAIDAAVYDTTAASRGVAQREVKRRVSKQQTALDAARAGPPTIGPAPTERKSIASNAYFEGAAPLNIGTSSLPSSKLASKRM